MSCQERGECYLRIPFLTHCNKTEWNCSNACYAAFCVLRQLCQINSIQICNWYKLESSSIIVNLFRIVSTTRLSTNSFLHKKGFIDNDKCTFCRKETENLLHLFWGCQKDQFFWNSVFKFRGCSPIRLLRKILQLILLWDWGQIASNTKQTSN